MKNICQIGTHANHQSYTKCKFRVYENLTTLPRLNIYLTWNYTYLFFEKCQEEDVVFTLSNKINFMLFIWRLYIYIVFAKAAYGTEKSTSSAYWGNEPLSPI